MSDIKKVVLAYSGGLDTSIILKWLQDTYGCEVVTFTADIGQGEEVEPARAKAEAMGVLRDMFGKNIPDATDIYVPRWWSSPYFRGSFSNWPIGVNRYEFDEIRVR